MKKQQKIIKISTMIISCVILNSCMRPSASNAIEELGSEVIKKHEGIDIRLMPIEEKKQETTKRN